MEERLKQRLVGAVVLVSLAVVFVPILFDMPGETSGETATDLISGIPERPQVEFGSSASGTLDVPQTPRLDTELERERSRNVSRAGTGERTASSRVSVAGATPSSPDPPASAQDAGDSGEPAAASPPAPSVARAESAPAKKEPNRGSATKPVAETSAAGGWTVQLGSFVRSENARALHKRLQAEGYPTFVESGSSARGKVSRVFVGPMPDREQAKASAAKLRREMALEGIVVPYPGG